MQLLLESPSRHHNNRMHQGAHIIVLLPRHHRHASQGLPDWAPFRFQRVERPLYYIHITRKGHCAKYFICIISPKSIWKTEFENRTPFLDKRQPAKVNPSWITSIVLVSLTTIPKSLDSWTHPRAVMLPCRVKIKSYFFSREHRIYMSSSPVPTFVDMSHVTSHFHDFI